MGAEPSLWILTRGRKGDLDQMVALAETAGLSYTIRTLTFGGPQIPALAPLLLSKSSDALAPPWPAMVMCAEALPCVIARGLKRKLGKSIKTVCVGRPAGSTKDFDLVITTAQYRLPSADNVLILSMPLTRPRMDDSAKAYDVHHRPLVALIIGGSAFPDRLDAETARKAASEVTARAEQQGGVAAVHTSPRTSPDVVSALRSTLRAPHSLHVYGEGENHYRALLAAADEIVVTSDSVSMVSDALETGKSVAIYPLPQSLNLQWRAAEWLYRNSVLTPSPLLAPVKWLFDAGVMEPSADRRLLFARLAAEGRISWFGDAPTKASPELTQRDLNIAAERLRALLV